MNVSDYILKFLVEKKVKNVFTITGGAICFLMDAFSRNNSIKYTPVAHEQAAAMMADSYSRLGPNFSAILWISSSVLNSRPWRTTPTFVKPFSCISSMT